MGKLQKDIADAQDKIEELEQEPSASENAVNKGDVEDLKKIVEDLIEQVTALKEEAEEETGEDEPDGEGEEEADTTPNDGTPQEETTAEDGDTQETAGDGTGTTDDGKLTIKVSLAEKKAENQQGTYVTFHSNKDVTIETIKYGELKSEQAPSQDNDQKTLSMTLPIAMKFTHDDTSGCVAARLDLVALLNGDNKKVTMEEKEPADSGKCMP